MGRTNIASGNDRVAVQVGRVTDEDDGAAASERNEPSGGATTVENVRSGNARVRVQADEIHGGLRI